MEDSKGNRRIRGQYRSGSWMVKIMSVSTSFRYRYRDDLLVNCRNMKWIFVNGSFLSPTMRCTQETFPNSPYLDIRFLHWSCCPGGTRSQAAIVRFSKRILQLSQILYSWATRVYTFRVKRSDLFIIHLNLLKLNRTVFLLTVTLTVCIWKVAATDCPFFRFSLVFNIFIVNAGHIWIKSKLNDQAAGAIWSNLPLADVAWGSRNASSIAQMCRRLHLLYL